MFNFYPGPSKIYPEVKQYARDAFDSGILEQNHRSKPFMDMMEVGIKAFRQKFHIPDDYKVYFTSSATECWEITAQSLFKNKIHFLYNGAFGKKWFKYAVTNPQVNSSLKSQVPDIRGSRYFIDQNVEDIEMSASYDTICWVSGETSNGTYVSNESIAYLRKNNPNSLLITDVTSTLGGVNYDFNQADVWFASSQKCLGLPSGLGIMIISPLTLERAKELNELNHYNSLLNIEANFSKNQTHYTPNILGIYLFSRLMQDIDPLEIVSEKITKRANKIYSFFNNLSGFGTLVKNELNRSPTVISVTTDQDINNLIKNFALKGIILGKGYGEWKENTFRVANFPAISDMEYQTLFKAFINPLDHEI